MFLLLACAPDAAPLYESTCAGCHGDAGDLGVAVNGVAAPALAVVVPLLSDDELSAVIEAGSGEMPPQLSQPADVRVVVAYLRENFGE